MNGDKVITIDFKDGYVKSETVHGCVKFYGEVSMSMDNFCCLNCVLIDYADMLEAEGKYLTSVETAKNTRLYIREVLESYGYYDDVKFGL